MDHSEVKHLKVDHTPAELDAASKLLLKAANLIEERGWCQYDLRTFDGRLCVNGAVLTATGLPMTDWFTDLNALEAVKRVGRAVNVGVAWRWNDEPMRTKDEVVAKLRAVALGL